MCDPAVPVVAEHYLGGRYREFFYNAVVDRICMGAENHGEPVSDVDADAVFDRLDELLPLLGPAAER